MRKTKTLSALVSISGAIVASLAAATAAHADITIGVVAPLTGPVAAYGDQVKNGVEAAVESINKNGGIGGEKLVLKLADDAGDPKQGVSAANQLVGEGIRFVVGPVTSGVAIPASDVFAENGVLMITPTATAPDLTKRSLTNVFRTCGRDDQQAEVAARYVLEHMKDKRIAVIHDNGTYGKGLADAFKQVINGGGVSEVLYTSLTPGEKDLSALVTRLKSENAEVIYFGGYHPEGGLLARQLHDIGVHAQIIGGEGLSNTEYWAIGNEAAAGTIFTNATDVTKSPASADSLKALKEKGIPPEAFTLNAYAAVEVLKYGIEKAGKADDAEAVATALKSADAIPTAIGQLSYGDNGDLTSPSFSLFKWENGQIVGME
ncbi:branched-chain amino acid ABC transporter substrate-binding protein [Mesorhizobium sp. BAC0120]|uniref:branched-chain amino acid ABC transporter substrate-binding protein n=1 Tax=Mesorhizobium sp. BAC0120 TaxID=3090670 RepID=UPI00298C40AC|nr:branched-chain amino acid ABC transporter substrate-binding protein [Mesorhizobium sp. BAC0120]MDW6022516.1 branched-chain amino acid ABC transporter substrate-binding protein [Mesorhizobium sp. BAC0120]